MLSGALDAGPVTARPVQRIPPRWDWVDPLKDIQAQVLAIETGLTSRRKVVEATGFELAVPDEVPESRLPTGEELHLIREVLDPQGYRKAEFGG